MVSVLVSLAVIVGEWSFCVDRSQAIQAETQKEKETNLKDQVQGGLFDRWTFHEQKPGEAPAGFSMLGFGEGAGADWTIKGDSDAPAASVCFSVCDFLAPGRDLLPFDRCQRAPV